MLVIRIVLGGLIPLAVAYSIGKLCFRSLPDVIALGLGAVIESLMVFGLLATGVARPPAFLALAAGGLLPLISRRTRFRAPVPGGLLLILIFAGYAIFYLIHALAPEIQPDAVSYHLGFVAECARTGGFPKQVTFYETLPQGMEMLFLFGFTIGKHSAAKLVDYGFLLATVPLMIELGRRLQLPDRVSGAAAALYFCSPLVGITGTSTYTDVSLVFFTLAVLLVLLIWKKEHNDRYLVAAGLLAGFCYCIKVSCLLVPLVAALFVASERRLRPALTMMASAAVAIGPWMIRDLLVTGSPLAPLANSLFPTQYFHLTMERSLTAYWRHYPGFSWRTSPRELTVGGRLQGNFGPIWFLLPVGLLALRRSVGRWIWLAALLLAYTWILNVGARFLMLSLPFLAFALAMSLDSLARPVLWACLAIHAITSLPAVARVYQSPDAWILNPFPWRAALRLESEHDYLARNIWAYQLLDFLREKTGPAETTFALVSLPNAYYERPVVDFWESALADRVMDAFGVANWRFAVRAEWPAQPLKALRFRMTAAHPGEWDLSDIRLYSDAGRVYSPKWLLRAWPNPWEAHLAFDDNLASRWRTWEPMRQGMVFEVFFDQPRQLTAAVLTTHIPTNEAPIEVYGLGIDGAWKFLSSNPKSSLQTPEDLHRAAMVFLKQSGIDYILAPTKSAGVWQTGKSLVQHARDWGLEDVGQRDEVHLLRIPSQLSMVSPDQPGPARTASPEELSIKLVDPPSTYPKIGFHVQPNGESAISIIGTGFEPGSVITANGHALKTTFGSQEWLTALAPPELYGEPGTIEFKVVNPNKKISNSMAFQVGAPAPDTKK
jgi:hypothetical protein